MAVYKRGRVWWYRFTWNGVPIRESTKQTNKRVAEQIEAAHKTSLAKGEVGIRQKKRAPTLAEFSESDFLPHVRSHFADKRSTLAYYEIQVRHLTGYPPAGKCATRCRHTRNHLRFRRQVPRCRVSGVQHQPCFTGTAPDASTVC